MQCPRPLLPSTPAVNAIAKAMLNLQVELSHTQHQCQILQEERDDAMLETHDKLEAEKDELHALRREVVSGATSRAKYVQMCKQLELELNALKMVIERQDMQRGQAQFYLQQAQLILE